MRVWRPKFGRRSGQRPTHYAEIFSASEWEQLSLAPLWAFTFVAQSDGTIDNKERDAFLHYLAESHTFPPGLPRDLLVDLFKNLENVVREFTRRAPSENPRNALSTARKIVDRKAPQDEAIMYKAAVLDVASEVARASGRLFRPKVSKDELKRIESIRKWLRLDTAALLSIYEKYNAQDRLPDFDEIARSRTEAVARRRFMVLPATTDSAEAAPTIPLGHDESGTRMADQLASEQASDMRPIHAEPDRPGKFHKPRFRFWIASSKESNGDTSSGPEVALGREVVQHVRKDMSVDDLWSTDHVDGFTWWAGSQAQKFRWFPVASGSDEDAIIVTAATDIVDSIRNNNAAAEAANALNMSAGLSAVVLDRVHRSALLFSSISVHDDTMHHTRTFSLAAAFQVAEAHQLGTSIATALGGELNESAHPIAGQRPEPDEMLQVLSDLPYSHDLVPLSEAEFAAALDISKNAAIGVIVESNADRHSLVAEFAFDHGTPAADLDPRNPVSFLGTSMLTISAMDSKADIYWAEIQNRWPQAATMPKDTGARQKYGSGLYVRLGLPLDTDEATSIAVAEQLNRLESQGASGNHVLGAWYGDAGGVWFGAFYPNLLIAPLERDQRVTTLVNIILSQAARSAWAKKPSEQLISSRRLQPEHEQSEHAQQTVMFQTIDVDAFVRFRDTGYAPSIVLCELGSTYVGDNQTNLPAGARIELWVNCIAVGMFRYPHVAVAFDGNGDITAVAAAELLPDSHDSCFLGRFIHGRHENFGSSGDWLDRDTFLRAAVDLLVPTLG